MSTTTAADAPSKLMDIPLELRYKIFEAAAERPNGVEHVFFHWFEKKDISQQINRHMAAHPNDPTPIARYSVFQPEPEPEIESEDENDNDDEMEGEEGEEGEDSEIDDDDDDDDDGENQDEADMEDEDEDMDTAEGHDGEVAAEQHEHEHEVESDQPAVLNMQSPTTSIQQPVTGTQEDTSEHATTDEGQEEEVEDDHDSEGEDTVDTDGNTVTQPANTAAPTSPPAPPPTVIQAEPKWRHVAKFMRITQCPPPTELLLTSKALNLEAMDWYYDTAVLRILATSGTVAHTSFFEEAFRKIADAAFSPVENIRKVEVTIVWDSTFLRALDNAETAMPIFEFMLGARADFIVEILQQAPMLKELVIHWHDSAQDIQSESLKLEILQKFLVLPGNVDVKEHYIAEDAKPYKKSIAGRFRMELQGIVDRGMDVLTF